MIFIDVSPIRLWQILSVEWVLVLSLLMIFMPIVNAVDPSISTLPATKVFERSAILNGNLFDLGTIPVPPVIEHGPETQVTPGFNTIKTISTVNSNFLLIIFGRGKNCGSLSSVTTNPSDTVQTLSGSSVSVGTPNTAQILDAKYVVNPTSNPAYEVNVAWTSNSCDYGSKFLTLYSLSGVDTSSPVYLNQVDTAINFDGHSGFTETFSEPQEFQKATFTMNHYENSLGSDDVHLKSMSGLTNSWGYDPNQNCSNSGAWCPEGGIGFSATATVNSNNNIDYAAQSLFINGTLTPRLTVDVYFQWGTSISLGSETTHIAKTLPTSFSENLLNLDSGTTYYFRACADTTCGSILSFTTTNLFNMIVGGFCLLIFVTVLTVFLLIAFWIRRKRGVIG